MFCDWCALFFYFVEKFVCEFVGEFFVDVGYCDVVPAGGDMHGCTVVSFLENGLIEVDVFDVFDGEYIGGLSPNTAMDFEVFVADFVV